MTNQEDIQTKYGADMPTPGEIIHWLGNKSPGGTLVLAIAFDIAAIGLWILGHAFKILGWFQ
jgi:hypothetical protein